MILSSTFNLESDLLEVTRGRYGRLFQSIQKLSYFDNCCLTLTIVLSSFDICIARFYWVQSFLVNKITPSFTCFRFPCLEGCSKTFHFLFKLICKSFYATIDQLIQNLSEISFHLLVLDRTTELIKGRLPLWRSWVFILPGSWIEYSSGLGGWRIWFLGVLGCKTNWVWVWGLYNLTGSHQDMFSSLGVESLWFDIIESCNERVIKKKKILTILTCLHSRYHSTRVSL